MRGRQSRPRATSWARPLGLVRLAVAVVLLTFGWRVSLAFATPCVHDHPDSLQDGHPSPATSRDDDEGSADEGHAASSPSEGCCPGESRQAAADDDCDDDGCSCPIDCGSCCGNAVMHVLPVVAHAPQLAVAQLAPLPVPGPSGASADAAPRGILHVPRSG